MSKIKPISNFIGFILVLGVFSAAWAQETGSSEFTLEEITVTAEKRTENLQKVPMSVEVIQGEDVRNTGRTSMQDLLKDIPNVSTTDAGNGVVTINIRGLGMDFPVGEGTGEAAVSTNFDGANQSRPEGQLFGFYDIERVEVLRGPQGTLYGRNATGGAVNIVSVKPTTDEVKGYTSLEVGTFNKMKAETAINIPIADTFAARLSTVFTQQDSYTKDDHGFRDNMKGFGSRLQLRYMPNEETSVNLLTSYSKTDGSTFGNYVTDDNWAAGKYDINRSTYPTDLTGKQSTETVKLALNVETPVGPGIVTLLPTLEKIKSRGSGYGYQLPPGVDPGPDDVPIFQLSGRPFKNEARTVELRYANKEDSAIKWVGGLYYTETDEYHAPNYGDYMAGARGNYEPGDPQPHYWYETGAVFGQSTVPLSDSIRLVLGVRYSYDKKSYLDVGKGVPSGSRKFSYYDWKAGVENDFSKDIMGYLTLSTGHKPGGYNANEDNEFLGEEAISGEVGVKSRMLDNRLQVNGDFFYYKYKNYQVVEFTPNPNFPPEMPPIFVKFTNAPDVTNYGLELDTTYILGAGTYLNASVAYLKSEYSTDYLRYDINNMDAEPQNLKGKPIPHTPELSYKLAVEHEFFLPDGSSITPRVSYRWTDGQYVGVTVSPDTWAPEYKVVDVSIAYASSKSWTLNFYCNNALDEHYYTAIEGAGGDNVAYAVGTPLTAGMILNVRF